MKQWLASGLALSLAACASVPGSADLSLDDIAREYVSLVLEIDAHESGYVDAYFGPVEWREAARRSPRERSELKANADRLQGMLKRFSSDDAATAQRAKVLLANVSSARFRLDMIDGKRVPFADEAEKLFALRPQLKPLSSYDGALKKIDALAPPAPPTPR